MADKQVKARAGINTLSCPRCKDGTLFVPITIEEISEMRADGKNSIVKKVKCSNGHFVEVSLFA